MNGSILLAKQSQAALLLESLLLPRFVPKPRTWNTPPLCLCFRHLDANIVWGVEFAIYYVCVCVCARCVWVCMFSDVFVFVFSDDLDELLVEMPVETYSV